MARNDALDTARAIAMMFVVATHAALSFMVTPIGWAVQDDSRHLGVDLYVWIVRAFAMPTFFWLSGYFARAVLDAGGLRGFARHRVTRILLPLAVALVPTSLALGALWDWGHAVAPRAAVAANIPKLQASEVPIVLGHLWYLYYLLWLSLAAVVVVWGAARLRVRVPARLGVLAVPTVLTIAVLASTHALHTDTPLGFVPDLPIALYMGAFVAWGWLVRGRPDDLAWYGQRAWRALAIAPVFLAIVVATLARGRAVIAQPPSYASAASAGFSIALIVGFLGLCVRHARPHRLVRLASESSYWCYIAHLPIVVALQLALAHVPVPGVLKYVVIVGVTTIACVGSYALFVRVTARRISAAHR